MVLKLFFSLFLFFLCQIASLAEEVRTLQQKLCDLEKARDQALAAVTNNEQIIKQLKTVSSLLQSHRCQHCIEILSRLITLFFFLPYL